MIGTLGNYEGIGVYAVRDPLGLSLSQTLNGPLAVANGSGRALASDCPAVRGELGRAGLVDGGFTAARASRLEPSAVSFGDI